MIDVTLKMPKKRPPIHGIIQDLVFINKSVGFILK